MRRGRVKLFALAGLSGTFLLAVTGCGSSVNPSSTSPVRRALPAAASASQLRAVAASAGHIGTYMRSAPPYDAVRKAAAAKHATIRSLTGGGLAVQYGTDPQSVYLVFPGAAYEVEVYDPSPARALRLATSGKVVPIP